MDVGGLVWTMDKRWNLLSYFTLVRAKCNVVIDDPRQIVVPPQRKISAFVH